jgi:putative flippase GtrA
MTTSTTQTPDSIRFTPNAIIRRVAARFGGENAKELERFLKFAVVGAIGAVIDLTITNIMLATLFIPSKENPTPAIFAGAIGFTTAVTSNFIWNRYWTYPESQKGNLLVQVTQFFLVNLVGLLIRAVILNLFTIPFGDFITYEAQIFFPNIVKEWSVDTPTRLGANMAVILALVIVMMWNFYINRKWTYKDVN